MSSNLVFCKANFYFFVCEVSFGDKVRDLLTSLYGLGFMVTAAPLLALIVVMSSLDFHVHAE